MDQILKDQQAVELLAEEVLIQKQLMIDLDRKRHALNMAKRQLMRMPETSTVHVDYHGMFLLQTVKDAKESIVHQARKVEEDIDTARNTIKTKTILLHEMNGISGQSGNIDGFNLKGVSSRDIKESFSV